MNSHSQEAGGAAIGGTLGFIKSLITLPALIDVHVVLDTMLLSAVGAVTGWVVTGLLKWIKNKLTK